MDKACIYQRTYSYSLLSKSFFRYKFCIFVSDSIFSFSLQNLFLLFSQRGNGFPSVRVVGERKKSNFCYFRSTRKTSFSFFHRLFILFLPSSATQCHSSLCLWMHTEKKTYIYVYCISRPFAQKQEKEPDGYNYRATGDVSR